MTRRSKRVGIRDVAAAAGMSIATVSWGLGNEGDVAPARRERVQRLAAEMGYRPDGAARAPQSGLTPIVGVVVGHRELRPWEEARLPCYRSVVAAAALGSLRSSVPYDGLMVIDPVRDDRLLIECRERAMPVLADGRPLDLGYEHVSIVDTDIKHGMDEVREDAAGAAARSIDLLSGAEVDAYTIDTERLYRTWCRRHRIEALVRKVRSGESPCAGAAGLPDRGADAVHRLNETYGNAALAVAADRRLGVPGARGDGDG